jgi:hypothetical protein
MVAMMTLTNHAAAELPAPGQPLTDQQVTAFARLALEGIQCEYPNKPADVVTGELDAARSPREMHPVFYGCFDWHSSVHGHWMLVRLAKVYPQSSVVPKIRDLLDQQLTVEKIATEAAYFQLPYNHSFERMYGWAWALRLAAELHTWDDPQAVQWAENFRPLETKIVELTKGYLPRLTYPVRTGVHHDTAFALAQLLDYARIVGDAELEQQIMTFCRQKYLPDHDYPAAFEPSGEDFFSASLNEADLMRRVLGEREYTQWLAAFLPDFARPEGRTSNLLQPVAVPDVTDGKLVHLAGLNLSRAWTQQGIAAGLPANDQRSEVLTTSIRAHTDAGLSYIFSGHYEGEHWLATFAIYLLSGTGLQTP